MWTASAQQVRMTPADYIMTYREAAVTEMKHYRIPASITLAQGMLESDNGNSTLARKANNHFGIKCKSDWKGETYLHDDDEKAECFRKYPSVWESYRDHSLFLTSRKHYAPCFALEITDYQGWAKALKAAGYATNPAYAELLIRIIEDYKLYIYDTEEGQASAILPNDTVATQLPAEQKRDTVKNIHHLVLPESKVDDFQDVVPGEHDRRVGETNGVRYITARPNDSYEKIASDFHLEVRELLRFNDLKDNAGLIPGQIVYVEEKQDKGPLDYHVVAEGETMYTISQKYAIRLKSLYSKNLMKQGTEAVTGQRLYLRKRAPVY